MMKLQHEFVKYIPEKPLPGNLYVSIEYRIAMHICPCGCGERVPTPITPADWELSLNGETVSLSPSIGNWNYKCQSHYWIKNNEIVWAPKRSKKRIEAGRKNDKDDEDRYFNNKKKKKT